MSDSLDLYLIAAVDFAKSTCKLGMGRGYLVFPMAVGKDSTEFTPDPAVDGKAVFENAGGSSVFWEIAYADAKYFKIEPSKPDVEGGKAVMKEAHYWLSTQLSMLEQGARSVLTGASEIFESELSQAIMSLAERFGSLDAQGEAECRIGERFKQRSPQ